jgi:hypothetical protein
MNTTKVSLNKNQHGNSKNVHSQEKQNALIWPSYSVREGRSVVSWRMRGPLRVASNLHLHTTK